jgi:TetR/AcrR family transcriptional regulator, transcriptional repressor for nem operon
VLDAACVLFGSQGVRTTSLDEIGAAADVGRGQLYHFFVDKADLVAEVVAFQVDRVIVSLRPSFEAMSTADDVRAWCDEVIAFHAASTSSIRCPIGSLINQLGDNDQKAHLALRQGFERWEDLLAAGLQRVADGGGLTPPADARTLAAVLLAAYQGGMLLADVRGDVAPLRRALQGITGLALMPATPTRAGKAGNRRRMRTA